MPGLLDKETENAKILYIGDSGHGKTGSKAALIAAGYKLRMIDTDRGFKILRSLLTDPRYPYAEFIKKSGIDLTEPGRISYIPIDVPMDFRSVTVRRQTGAVSYDILAPSNARAWSDVISLLKEWVDGDLNLGPITDWDQDCILDFDTLSTLAENAKYWVQEMNGRLGALEDDHGRDSGAAQELINRLMTKLTSPAVRCNVIVTTHISWLDVTRGAPLTPSQILHDNMNKMPQTRGFPTVIGKALSPYLGKKWNDLFICGREGSGSDAERRIFSVPRENTDAKHSAFVEDSYPLSTGLAEIFAALRFQDPPTDLIDSVRAFEKRSSKPSDDKRSSGGFGGSGGFGRR